jgi:hypothetical protein
MSKKRAKVVNLDTDDSFYFNEKVRVVRRTERGARASGTPATT